MCGLGLLFHGDAVSDRTWDIVFIGVAMLAARTGAPVIPIGFIGTDKAQPVGSKMIRPFKTITIRIGPPVDFGVSPDQPKGQRVLRAMTDAVMTEIQRLSGQEYTGKYASLGDKV